MLPALSFRKCDSLEHLVCFCLVDMLNLINDSVSPLYFGSEEAWEQLYITIWCTFLSADITLGVSIFSSKNFIQAPSSFKNSFLFYFFKLSPVFGRMRQRIKRSKINPPP